MTAILSCRLPCCRCDQLRVLRADDLCDQCGTAHDTSLRADRRHDDHYLSKTALERALGLETSAA